MGCAFGLVCDPAAAAPEPDLIPVASSARKSVVRVSSIASGRPTDAFERVGVAVRADGLILMAGPVVAGRERFTVRLADGAIASGQLVAADPETALTLLRVTGPSPVPLAGLDSAKPATTAPSGSSVVMVTPEGAVARGALRAGNRYDRVLISGRITRTTALLEAALVSLPHDRGAPWLDAQGALIGLHYGRALGFDPVARERARALGLRMRREVVASYAVPARVARIVWPLLAAHGRVPRGALDVSTQAMDDAMRAQLCPRCGGHVILDLRPEGAAAAAGLRLHDVIVAVAGEPVPVGGTLQDALLPHRPGAQVALEVLRAGKRQTIPVRLRERTQRVATAPLPGLPR